MQNQYCLSCLDHIIVHSLLPVRRLSRNLNRSLAFHAHVDYERGKLLGIDMQRICQIELCHIELRTFYQCLCNLVSMIVMAMVVMVL